MARQFPAMSKNEETMLKQIGGLAYFTAFMANARVWHELTEIERVQRASSHLAAAAQKLGYAASEPQRRHGG